MAECLRNLAAVLAMDKRREVDEQIEPEPGTFDGEPLTVNDLQKIKGKACRVFSCEDVPVKTLFDRNSRSVNHDKD
jgi:hypothetical protein